MLPVIRPLRVIQDYFSFQSSLGAFPHGLVLYSMWGFLFSLLKFNITSWDFPHAIKPFLKKFSDWLTFHVILPQFIYTVVICGFSTAQEVGTPDPCLGQGSTAC